jgi:hypothetical protein
MHVASSSTSDDNDAAMRRWAPCSPLDDIADSDAAGMLPMIYSMRAGGGRRGGGGCGRVMLLRLMGVIGTVGLWQHKDCFL